MTTPADVRNRILEGLLALHQAYQAAGTSGPLADPIKLRAELTLAGHYVERALLALARQTP